LDLDLIKSETLSSGINQNLNVRGSYTPLSPHTEFKVMLIGQGLTGTQQVQLTGSQFFITSSDVTGQQVGLVAEPYFGSNDFNRALDCQPLLNNAERVRKHNLYQDIDYSAGVNEPVNFDLLISGSATRAEVQFSNYTTRRHIIPRYIGSKSTSQELNTWTEGDTGTYGKTPTVESLKTVVAYCDFIGGWPPERMNASTAHILYIIDQDGNIGIPNTSENSLPNVQGSFQTGERFRISSETIGSGEATPFRTVIRGGQRLEPILYTQSGSVPPANFTSSISLIDPTSQNTSSIVNKSFNSTLRPISGEEYGAFFVPFQQVTIGSVEQGSFWNITYDPGQWRGVDDGSEMIFPGDGTAGGQFPYNQNIIMKVEAVFHFKNLNPTDTISFVISFNGTGTTTGVTNSHQYCELTPGEEKFIYFNEDILPSNYQVGARYSFILYQDGFPNSNYTPDESVVVLVDGTYWNCSQSPLPNPLGQIQAGSGENTIWDYPINSNFNKLSSSLKGIIHIPSASGTFNQEIANDLNIYYSASNVFQQNHPESGFNPITFPWSVEIGDEFRFEGEETNAYMVKKVFAPSLSSPERISNTGSLEVHLAGALPSSSINLDHFLIRRYTNDASRIIFEGFKPLNSQGPYILTPEYASDKLNKSIDEYISDLTQKGLL
jgi:hypothetical protein